MRVRTLVSVVIVTFIVFAGLSQAQEKSNVKINQVAAPPTSAASGGEMYRSYCASCHGKDGKGDGPAAPALKIAPTDLTQLAKQNKGVFPSAHVSTVLQQGAVVAHGSTEMPVWGPIFRNVSNGSQAQVLQRSRNLTKYIESMQAK
ncbi:MAG TPA: c-type cytochrome [Terriglobales bacterium]|nr:c-type cytochrome [Terriglobales bacterium]